MSARASSRERALAEQAWAAACEPLDRQLSPLGLKAMAALAPRSGERVVDVGCGAGQTLVQLAEAVGPAGGVVGVDVSPRLLQIARARTAALGNVSLMEADAEVAALPSGGFDAIFSRFGVMAFADPVAAFANLRQALTPEGRLAFVCWRALAENDLDLIPLRAAGLEALADRTPFAFEHEGRIRDVLGAAGFRRIAVAPHDERVGSGGVEPMLAVVLTVGPLGRILRENPALRAAAEPAVRRALAACDDPRGATLKAATWIVTARA